MNHRMIICALALFWLSTFTTTGTFSGNVFSADNEFLGASPTDITWQAPGGQTGDKGFSASRQANLSIRCADPDITSQRKLQTATKTVSVHSDDHIFFHLFKYAQSLFPIGVKGIMVAMVGFYLRGCRRFDHP